MKAYLAMVKETSVSAFWGSVLFHLKVVWSKVTCGGISLVDEGMSSSLASEIIKYILMRSSDALKYKGSN